MFFHTSQFKDLFPEADADLFIKRAHEILSAEGKLMFGTELEDGSRPDWSDVKKPMDTHVALQIGTKMMGQLEPRKSPVRIERISEEDMIRAKDRDYERLKRLESQGRL